MERDRQRLHRDEAARLQPELRRRPPDGVVVIDTPQLPTKAVAMREAGRAHGPIRYLDQHRAPRRPHLRQLLLQGRRHGRQPPGRSTSGSWSSTRSSTRSRTPTRRSRRRPQGTDLDDPEGVALWPDRDEYYRDPNKGRIVFTGDLTLRVGDHTFHLLHTPGHTPGQLAVHVPEERVVFTGDTIFSGCQTWLMTSDVDQWLAALERIRTLDVDRIVPGHGPVVTKALPRRPALAPAWSGRRPSRRRSPSGWSRDETIARVNFKDRFGPVDIGQGYMLDYIQNLNAGSLYDKLTGAIPGA